MSQHHFDFENCSCTHCCGELIAFWRRVTGVAASGWSKMQPNLHSRRPSWPLPGRPGCYGENCWICTSLSCTCCDIWCLYISPGGKMLFKLMVSGQKRCCPIFFSQTLSLTRFCSPLSRGWIADGAVAWHIYKEYSLLFYFQECC